MTEPLANFIIPGQPQGKGRARAFVRNGHVAHYTPEKTRSYEGVITSLAMDTMGQNPPSEGALMLDVEMYFEVPKSWPNWKRDLALSGRVVPTTKPDTDNVLKAIKDALNGVVWKDDCQVVAVFAAKHYSTSPRVAVKVVLRDKQLPAQTKRRPAA